MHGMRVSKAFGVPADVKSLKVRRKVVPVDDERVGA